MSEVDSDTQCFARLSVLAAQLAQSCDQYARGRGDVGGVTARLSHGAPGRLGNGWVKDWRLANDVPDAVARPLLGRVVVPVVLASRTQPDLGIVADLVLEAIGNGGAEIYPSIPFTRVARCYMTHATSQESAALDPESPLGPASSPLDTVASVGRAGAVAWREFWKTAADRRAQGDLLETAVATRALDVRWSLQRSGGLPLDVDISGDSLGASVARGVSDLLEGRTPDPRVVVTASLDEEGRFGAGDEDLRDWPVHHVGLVRQKAAAVVACGLDTLVVTSQKDAAAAQAEIDRLKGNLRVVWFDEPRFGARIAGIQARGVEELEHEVAAYLRELRSHIEGIPGIFPAGAPRGTVRRIRQKARVVARSSDLDHGVERAEEQARARAGEGKLQPPPGPGDEDSQPGRERSKPPPSAELIDWDDEIWGRSSNAGRLVLFGDPGYGKTTTLCGDALALVDAWQTMLRLRGPWADEAKAPHLPFFVRLPDIAGADLTDGLRSALVRRATGRELPRSDGFATFVGERLRRGRAAVFLDALDEVFQPADRARLIRAATDLANTDFAGRLCVSSRIVGSDWPRGAAFTEVELWGFDLDQIEGFVGQWFKAAGKGELAAPFLADAGARPELSGLIRVPITLALLCRIYEEPPKSDGARLPPLRVELYGSALDLFVRDRARLRGKDDAWIERNVGLLENVFVQAFLRGAEALTDDALIALIVDAKGLRKHGEPGWEQDRAAAAEAREEMLGLGILVAAGPGRYLPLHQSFAEYLTARGIAARVSREGWALWRARIDRWAWRVEKGEVLALLAGLLASSRRDLSERLLALLANPRLDDDFRHRLALAVRCAEEVPRGTKGRDEVAREAYLLWYRTAGMESWLPHVATAWHLTRQLPSIARIDPVWEDGRRLLEFLPLWLGSDDHRASTLAEVTMRAMGPAVLQPAFVRALLAWLEETGGSWQIVQVLLEMRAAACNHDVLEHLLRRLRTATPLRDHYDIASALIAAGTRAGDPQVRDELWYGGSLGITPPLGAEAPRWEGLQRALLDHRDAILIFDKQLEAYARTGDVVAMLRARLTDSSIAVRRSAVTELQSMLRHAAEHEILDELRRRLGREPLILEGVLSCFAADTSPARQSAFRVAVEIAPPSARAKVREALLPFLRGSEALIAADAMDAVGRLGADGANTEVLDLLRAAYCSERRELRWQAGPTLMEIGPAAARADILDLARDRSDIPLLAAFGAAAVRGDILGVLRKALFDSHEPTRSAAADAVGALGPEAVDAEMLEGLRRCLRDGAPAMKTIRRMGPAVARDDVVDALLGCIERITGSWNHVERWRAIRTVGALGAAAARPDVLRVLARSFGGRAPTWKLEASEDRIRQTRPGSGSSYHGDHRPAAEALRSFFDAGVRIVRGRVMTVGQLETTGIPLRTRWGLWFGRRLRFVPPPS